MNVFFPLILTWWNIFLIVWRTFSWCLVGFVRLRFLFSSLHVSYWPTAHARKMIQLLYSMPLPMISARSPCLFILHKWSSQQFQSMLRSIILWMIQIWYCPVLSLKYYPNGSIKMFSNSKYKEDRISDF